MIFIISRLKSTEIREIGVFLQDKNWATLTSLAEGKKANVPQFGALNFLATPGYGLSLVLCLALMVAYYSSKCSTHSSTSGCNELYNIR